MVFKQLLQAEAIDVVQIDSCRLAGVSEVLAVLLMAAKYVFQTLVDTSSEELLTHRRFTSQVRCPRVSARRRRRSVRVRDPPIPHRLHRRFGNDGAQRPGVCGSPPRTLYIPLLDQ